MVTKPDGTGGASRPQPAAKAAGEVRGRRPGFKRRGAANPYKPYLRFVLRWWWLLVAGAALGAGGTVGYLNFGPVPFQSTAMIMVPTQSDPAADPLGSPATVRGAAVNFVAQMASPYIYDLVVRTLQGQLPVSARELVMMEQNRQLDIRQQRGANLISITVTDRRPDFARMLADTIAKVFVDDVNGRAGSQVETRKKELEQQIELARQRLTTAQLSQREQDIVKQLQLQRTQLIQLQLQYQQELQRQVETDRQAQGPAPARDQVALTPAQQQRAQELAGASAAARAQRLQLLGQQQEDAERTLAELNGQLAEVRAALGELPEAQPDTDATAAAQREQELLRELRTRRTDLQQREQTLTRELQSQRNQLRQIQLQYQQELQRNLETEQQQVVASGSNQGTLTPAQQRRVQELATGAAAARAQRLQVIGEQQKDVERTITDLSSQLTEVRAALGQLPAVPADADPAGSAQQREQDPQRELRTRRANLQQREQTLAREVRDQRNQVRQLQIQYQEELRRHLETEQQQVLAAGGGQASLTPPQQQRVQELAGAQTRVRNQWLQLIGEQQREVEQTVADLNNQLSDVRAALRQLPENADPTVSAAFAAAYAQQLQSLTQSYVRLQLAAPTATAPVMQYGPASEPLPALRLKKTLLMSTGVGLLIAAGLAYLLDFTRRQRRGRARLNELTRLPAAARPAGAPTNGKSAVEDWTATPVGDGRN